jgi:hypothetical protein
MSHRIPLVSVLILIVLALTASAAFAQAGGTKQVGLVVTFPDGTTHTEVVSVPADGSTLDALRAAKLTIATAESGQGTSLCKINETGCPADNCFCDAEHFWAYYHLKATDWAAAQEAASAFVPANGAVEGFAWSGFDPQFNPTTKPPVSTFDQLVGSQTGPVPPIHPVIVVLLILLIIAIAVTGFLAWRSRAKA